MALSSNLIYEFAKLTKQEKKDEGSEIKGTFKVINGQEYVQIDGSDILTPVTTAVEAVQDERVLVLIKDHQATVTKNITSPAARNKSVQDIKDEVDEFGNTIQQMDNTIIQQNNSIIQMNNTINQQGNTINQHDNLINQQGDQIISLDNLIVQQGNNISLMNNTINQQGDNIDSMNNTIVEHGNNINSMNNIISQQGNTITQQGNTITQQGNLITQQNNIIQEQGNQIVAIDNTVNIQGSDIVILNSGFKIVNGVLTGLSEAILNTLKVDTLDAGYAKIDFANIEMAAVEKLFADSGIIKDLIVEEGHISGELVGVTIKGDLIEGNTIVADKLVVKGSDGIYYKLNILGETIETEQTNQNSLNGSVITAKSITASKITVTDLVAFGATIAGFIIDQASIHSIGKDAIDSDVKGLYLGKDGQFYLGDSTDHIKYYKDQNGDYILDIRASKVYLGTSTATVGEVLDSKKRNFTTTPVPPYDIGDLWTQGSTGDILRCETSRFSGAYVETDWIRASKYTDDTTANIVMGLVDDISSDEKFTPVEKYQTLTEWNDIIATKINITSQVNAFELLTSSEYIAYNDMYTQLEAYLTPLLLDPETTSDINGISFRTTFKNYYDSENAILNKISIKAKALYDEVKQANESIATNLDNNYLTTEATNELIVSATNGLINTFSKSGGNNLIQNASLFFGTVNLYDYWSGNLEQVSSDLSVSKKALKLKNNTVTQVISRIGVGDISIRFAFKKIGTGVGTTLQYKINNTTFDILPTEGVVELSFYNSSGSDSLSFICNQDDQFIIYDLMMNYGKEIYLPYQQAMNELKSSTVSISENIKVESNVSNTITILGTEGLTGYNKTNGSIVFKQTETGLYSAYMKADEAEISDLMIKKIGNQVWLTGR